jgi:hypothetical protein
MSAAGVAGERSAVSSAPSWSARRSSSAGSVGAAATKTVAWAAVCGPGPAVEPVVAVVGDAAALAAVVGAGADGRDAVVVELGPSAADVEGGAGPAVVVVEMATAGWASFAPP